MPAVGRWVLEGSSTRIRQMAARAISDLDQLRDLIRATRGGNDKNVYRILTARRDELLAETRRRKQQQAEVEEVAAAVDQLCGRAYDATYETTLARLEARWQTLATHAAPDVQREFAQHLARAHEVIEQHRETLEAESERQRSAALAAEEARRRRELDAQAAASAVAERARTLEAERQAEQAKRESDEAEVRRLLGLLRQAQAALDQGGTARAARLRDAIKENLPQAPALPPWFARKLEQVDSRIGELQDWKTFTVVPKRTELLREMQSLIDTNLAPEERARRIRRLRDDWRTLHRGAGQDPSPEWQQFEDAAERAYEPCREYFAGQAELRRANQAHREALLQRLANFAAEQTGETVNLSAVRQAIFEARREWQSYAPVDHAAVKPLQARFRTLLDELQTRLDAEYARNVQVRRELIARAAELFNVEDTRQAIDEAKSLQRTWKAVGPVPRQQHQALWEEFRRHCDAVFQRSAQESVAYAEALEANRARATDLCEELERMVAQPDESLLSGLQHLDERRAEFESLELPRASARDLRRRFSHAVDRCTEALRRHRAAAARRGWTDLLAAAAQVREYALATAVERPAADCEALRASAAAAVANLAHTPKASRAVLEQQLAKIRTGAVGADLATNEAMLRLLCVRAELIADLPTPPEDLAMRRDYQMQRLVESMGRGERVTPAEFDDLAREWIAVGPVDTTVHDALLARFQRCRDACEERRGSG